jgi:ATP-dependent helicase/nuclease subunit B
MGLNEGYIPVTSELRSPYLPLPVLEEMGFDQDNHAMREQFHFFLSAVKPQTIFSRCVTQDGQMTTPSRFLVHLQTYLLQNGNKVLFIQNDIAPLHQKLYMPRCERIWLSPPMPSPPLDRRPQRLSISDIEVLRRDPYRLYAKSVLKLAPLNNFDAPPSPADKGNLYHKILEIFVGQNLGTLEALQKLATDIISKANFPDFTKYVWTQQFLNISPWLFKNINDVEVDGRLTEKRLERILTVASIDIKIFGIADRIDITKSACTIVDYKTGGIPSKKEIAKGYSPQLNLLNFLNESNFSSMASLSYWLIKSRPVDCKIIPVECMNIHDALTKFLKVYYETPTPYLVAPNPVYKMRYNPYAHLERYNEWGR